MKRAALALLLVPLPANAQLYKDPNAPVEARAEDLLSRMTLDEKLAQMSMNSIGGSTRNPLGIGVVDSPFISAEGVARYSAQGKTYAREKTRLGIPPIQIAECLHGVMASGATIFPQTENQGATWNPALIERMGTAIASEASALGVDQALSPLFDLVRDARYGRNEECFAEDPYLTAQLGCAFVRGMQGDPAVTRTAIPENHVMCTGKHFAAYSYPLAGVNLAPAPVGERELRTMFLEPFRAAVQDANLYAVMPSYNEIDGIPAHSSTFLLDQVLRHEWNFPGYVISDYSGLGHLVAFHHVARTPADAALMGLTAGVDVEAARPEIYPHLADLLRAGTITEKQIDTAVRRILTAKFRARLFEKPLADATTLPAKLHTPDHAALSRQIADESIVLLKNDNNVLPLDLTKLHSIAVVGPNADKVQYGDYSFTRDNRSGTTVLQSLKAAAGGAVKINYAQGCELSGTDTSHFDDAVRAAENSDVTIAVLGTTSVVFQGIGWNGQSPESEPKDPFTCGEGYDVTDISPQGVQRDLLQALAKTGKPIVLVLIKGRPWSISWEKDHLPAILDAGYPGEAGGAAIADVLLGKTNPSGRLATTIPQSTGHIPCYYNYLNSSKGNNRDPGTPDHPGRDYVFSSTAPLYPFGHGLSYTTFHYDNLKLSSTTLSADKPLTVTFTLTNTGDREGMDVPQLYIGNKVNSVSTPVLSLKRFRKLSLKPHETQTLTFALNANDLAIWNRQMKHTAEPGPFDIQIGPSSDSLPLHATAELLP